MKIDLDYKFSESIYIKSDPEQLEYLLNRIIIEPKGRVSLELLCPNGDIIEVYAMHTTKVKDILKSTGADTEIDEED